MNAFHTLELARLRTRPQAPPDAATLNVNIPDYPSVTYMPIIGVCSGEAIGFQTVPRYSTSHLHGRPERALDELALQRQQIAHAPRRGWLMLQLDASRFLALSARSQHAMLQLLGQYVWSEREIVVKLACADDRADPAKVGEVADRLQRRGIAIAVEESDLRRGLISLAMLLDAAVVLFDSSALRLKTQGAAAVEVLLRVARDAGIEVVMTGVDHVEHYRWAGRMGVDGVQGRFCTRDGGGSH